MSNNYTQYSEVEQKSDVQILLERIEKLEKWRKMRDYTIGIMDQAYNDAVLNLEARIVRLESIVTKFHF
jgi:hypothetical protein